VSRRNPYSLKAARGPMMALRRDRHGWAAKGVRQNATDRKERFADRFADRAPHIRRVDVLLALDRRAWPAAT